MQTSSKLGHLDNNQSYSSKRNFILSGIPSKLTNRKRNWDFGLVLFFFMAWKVFSGILRLWTSLDVNFVGLGCYPWFCRRWVAYLSTWLVEKKLGFWNFATCTFIVSGKYSLIYFRWLSFFHRPFLWPLQLVLEKPFLLFMIFVVFSLSSNIEKKGKTILRSWIFEKVLPMLNFCLNCLKSYRIKK